MKYRQADSPLSMDSPPHRRLRRARWMLIALFILLFASACSPKTDDRNIISPYDEGFDPDEDEVGKEKVAANLSVQEQYELLDEAMGFYHAELYSAARDTLASIQRQYPGSYYAPLVDLKLADSNYFLGEYQTAIELYEEFLRLRPQHEAAAYARLQIGNSHFAQYRGVVFDQGPLKQAQQQYEQVVQHYPGTAAARDAAEMLRRCQSLRQAHQAYVAEFYHGQGLDNARRNRVKKLLAETSPEQAKPLLDQEVLASFSEEELQQLAAEARAQHRSQATSASSQEESREFAQRLASLKKPAAARSSEPSEAQAQQRRQQVFCSSTSSGTLIEILLPIAEQHAFIDLSRQALSTDSPQEWTLRLPAHESEAVLAAEGCAELALDLRLEAAGRRLRINSDTAVADAQLLAVDRPQRLLLALFR